MDNFVSRGKLRQYTLGNNIVENEFHIKKKIYASETIYSLLLPIMKKKSISNH